ncbi:MAG: 2-polyprenyl-3-methyl-5-hydroxy-6-metoxy-1,4-benzoquinol methylase [Gammaproteobacteria bacterium]|jgi:2-polyprenyl-3-methyl-5-hydroxy-6-metoxy-1,4-benzoquinol methylase
MAHDTDHYDNKLILTLEQMWGKGYLSPGGQDEVARVLKGIPLQGKRILDIGCGSGGITAGLAKDFRADHVVGIDIESPVCEAAMRTAKELKVEQQVEIIQVAAGPIPLEDESFDIVFSKDSIIHIANKQSLCADVFRLLKPGGLFVASDWLTDRDAPSEAMQTYLTLEDLGFGMASSKSYTKALESAGFEDINFVNRGPWYSDLAQQELKRLKGDERTEFLRFLSPEDLNDYIDVWTAMVVVLKSGELCPHHFRGRKPLS